MEPFKDEFNSELIEGISVGLARASDDFDAVRFERLAKDGLAELELKARSAHIGNALLDTLPADFEAAAEVIDRSLEHGGILGWAVMPVGYFVAERGISSPERGLQTLKELTKRFTSEDPIRRFIIDHPEVTLAELTEWVHDDGSAN